MHLLSFLSKPPFIFPNLGPKRKSLSHFQSFPHFNCFQFVYNFVLQSLGLCPKGGQPKTQNVLRNFHSLFVILHFGPFLKFSWHFLTTVHLLSMVDRVSTYVLIMCPDWKKINQQTTANVVHILVDILFYTVRSDFHFFWADE